MAEPLIDGHGRRISDLRVSVTDRCNFRCQYCMPAEGLPWLERAQILSFEEIERLVDLFVALGIEDVRLTGGEPLVRREFPRLVEMLAAVDGLRDLSLTTNGYLLERDAAALVDAGIQRVNVSIDSLQRDRFFQITRRDALPRVLRGLDAIAAFPQVHPIKVNAVAMRGFSEDEALRFARVRPLDRIPGPLHRVHAARRRPRLDPRLGSHAATSCDGSSTRSIRSRSCRASLRRRLASSAFATARERSASSIRSSEPFCADCNRIRLTAEGKLRTCLFSLHETDLRGPLREGAGDAEIETIIRDAVWRKELKHHVGEPGFRQPARTMSAIGG